MGRGGEGGQGREGFKSSNLTGAGAHAKVRHAMGIAIRAQRRHQICATYTVGYIFLTELTSERQIFSSISSMILVRTLKKCLFQ